MVRNGFWVLGILIGLHTPVLGAPVQEVVNKPVVVTARLVGQVRDEQGNPVAEAQIVIGPGTTSPKTVRTDSSGAFALEQVTPGRWSIEVNHERYDKKEVRVWLSQGLTTPVDFALTKLVLKQPATRVGLVGVGTLPQTDGLAQRLAGELVRLGAFPQVQPLSYIERTETLPVLRKLGYPLYEILDHDRPDDALVTSLVKEFFEYLGLKALVVTRVDMFTEPEGDKGKLNSNSKVELWELADGRVRVRTLTAAGRSSIEDASLSKTEIEQIYETQITKMAVEVSEKWVADNPLAVYTDAPPAPPQGQQTDTEIKIIPQPPTPPVPLPQPPRKPGEDGPLPVNTP